MSLSVRRERAASASALEETMVDKEFEGKMGEELTAGQNSRHILDGRLGGHLIERSSTSLGQPRSIDGSITTSSSNVKAKQG